MKKNVFAIIICTIGLLMASCNGPFNKQKCTVEGVLVMRGNPCMSDPCMPGVGWWLQTSDRSYAVEGNWLIESDEGEVLNVGGTIAHLGDSVRATGTSCSYRDIHKEIFYSLTIKSLEILVPSKDEITSEESDL